MYNEKLIELLENPNVESRAISREVPLKCGKPSTTIPWMLKYINRSTAQVIGVGENPLNGSGEYLKIKIKI